MDYPIDIKEQLDEIKQLYSSYPYCNTLGLIYLEKINTEEASTFQTILPKTAINISDRTKLYYFIFRQSLNKITSKVLSEQKHASTPHIEASLTKKTQGSIDSLEREYLKEAVTASILLDLEKESSAKLTLNQPKPKVSLKQDALHSFTKWMELLQEKSPNESASENKPTGFYSPEKMAKLSLIDNEEIVTETLAQIYAAQGAIEKAIRVYNKLSLKFPEKNDYFASQIKKIKTA